ncbi:MAG: CocE/NonD family hydrolase [Bryobacteraceae bacterium]|nr:CocE/NonD family hydrolase [Bryobacteraceae bacterium]
MLRTLLLRAILFACVCVTRGEGQKPEAGRYAEPQFKVKATIGTMVSMRDGVRLSVDIYRPDSKGRFPVILTHIPYDNMTASTWFGQARARWFAERGYVFALSDFRGRYDSEGTFDIFDHRHKTDGYDLVEWLARQPWADGKVGMTGPSYMGWSQWWAASQAPPSLKAIVPEVAPPDQFYNGPYQDGILVCWAMDWGAGMMAGRTNQRIGEGAYGGFANGRADDYMHLPYLDLPKVKGAANAPWFETWIRQNLSTFEYWKKISYQGIENYSKITVPALNITGWFDGNFPGSPMNYIGMKQHGATPASRRPRLIIGPWSHGINTRELVGFDYGADAVLDLNGIICRWFDHFLKGVDNGVERDPPVQVFVMGVNRWYAESDWPLPQTHWTRYYLHSGGSANSLKGDGTLTTHPPGEEPPDTYVYDPADPTPDPFDKAGNRTMPVRRVGHIEGAVDTRIGAIRDDVLVYQTPPLDADVELTGPIEAKLFAATSARDTDWMMRIMDVHPDGYAALLADGIMRARCRDPENAGAYNPEKLSEIKPDTVYEYTIRFWRAVGNVFQKGHRIRIEVSSSYYPYYLRNLNTGADNVGLETKWVVAKQKIYHNGQYPSSVLLPLIPPRTLSR